METDILHEPNEKTEWNESFYFNFYDKANDVCAFMRIGLKPNKDEKSMFCFIMLPDGSYAGSRSSMPIGDNELSVNGLSYEKIVSGKTWGLRFSGPMKIFESTGPEHGNVEFDLRFTGLDDIFNYRECVSGFNETISQSVASEHLEQYGKVEGHMELNGKRFDINGLGERDHSWGVRDWNAPKMWIWLTAEFSEGIALNVTKLSVEQGVVDAGFFHIDGSYHPIIGADIDTVYGKNGEPLSFVMELKDKKGIVRTVDAEIIRNVMLPFTSDDGNKESVMHETLAQYEFEGMKGFGIAEYLIKK